jgi:hypothetical protein
MSMTTQMTADQSLRPSRLSPARIEARDRRNAAIHEAGHVVMARHVGVHVEWAEIWPNDHADEGEKAWIGRCRFHRPRPVSQARMAMIAVAGTIAEHVWDDDCDFLRAESEWPWEEESIMSPSDWLLAGVDPGSPTPDFMRAVRKVIDLLTGPLKPELYATARRLIVDCGRGSRRPAFSRGAGEIDDDIPF